MNLNYYGINFATRGDTEAFLSEMLEIAEMYERVTLVDVFDLAGTRSVYDDNKWYWNERDILIAKVIRLEDYYTIELPNLKHVDSNESSTKSIVRYKSYVKSSPEPLNICIHVNDLEDPDAVLANTFKYIYTIRDRMVNLTIM